MGNVEPNKKGNRGSLFIKVECNRLGWRGYAKFDGLPEHTRFIWQVETGYVDPSFSPRSGSYFGERDTFVGFDSQKFGLVRAGRVLTPIYELVDWPGSNPGLGDVWDWGGYIGGRKHNDRQSDTIRWICSAASC
ncbi:hypothetical protein GZ77_06940 [Endozoicomonas montiporae]|uniref:Porin domain-containing protein n=2 Tax=Endozoicomonas montiporae TaxID=1027273 RepID=A0A081N6V1_9GAMM|nr:membrane protein [Endozoicomonas montiporae CL-33]KEQ14174.1 hypothetical protein GZ77_06940 [Endozoicomonas montiporae]